MLPNGQLVDERRKLLEQERPPDIEQRKKSKTFLDYFKWGRRKKSSGQERVGWPVGKDRRRKGRDQQFRPDVLERRKKAGRAPDRPDSPEPDILASPELNNSRDNVEPAMPPGPPIDEQISDILASEQSNQALDDVDTGGAPDHAVEEPIAASRRDSPTKVERRQDPKLRALVQESWSLDIDHAASYVGHDPLAETGVRPDGPDNVSRDTNPAQVDADGDPARDKKESDA